MFSFLYLFLLSAITPSLPIYSETKEGSVISSSSKENENSGDKSDEEESSYLENKEDDNLGCGCTKKKKIESSK